MGHHKQHKVFAEAVSEMKHFLLGAALVLALVTVVPALAQTPPPGGDMGASPAGAPQGGQPQGGQQGGMQNGTQGGMQQGGQPQGGQQGGFPQGGFQQGGQPQGGVQGEFPGQGNGVEGGFPGQGKGVQGGFPGMQGDKQGGFQQGGTQGGKAPQGGFQQGGKQQGGFQQGGNVQGGMQQGGKQQGGKAPQGGSQGGMTPKFNEGGDVAAPQGGLSTAPQGGFSKGGKGMQGGFPGQGKGVEGGFPGQGNGVEGGFPGMGSSSGMSSPEGARIDYTKQMSDFFNTKKGAKNQPELPVIEIPSLDVSDLDSGSDAALVQVENLITGMTSYASIVSGAIDSGALVAKNKTKKEATKVKNNTKKLADKIYSGLYTTRRNVCLSFTEKAEQKECSLAYTSLKVNLSAATTADALTTALSGFQKALAKLVGLDAADEEETEEEFELDF